jgi:hypothetical protein
MVAELGAKENLTFQCFLQEDCWVEGMSKRDMNIQNGLRYGGALHSCMEFYGDTFKFLMIPMYRLLYRILPREVHL